MQSTRNEVRSDRLSLLVVEEGRNAYQRIRQLLGGRSACKHYHLQHCRSVREALARVRHRQVDMVFLPYELACGSHRDYLRWAERFGLEQPLVLFGPCLRLSEERQLIAEGAADYLYLEQLDASALLRSIRYAQELQARRDRIRRLLDFDDLTGIPSRQHFYRNLIARMERARAAQRELGLLLVNLDGFKRINNSLGQRVGESAILEAVTRIRSVLRPGQQLARLSEDQFSLSLVSRQAALDLRALAEALAGVLQPPYRCQGRSLVLGASLGCALYPEDGADLDELLRQAGTALHLAKQEQGSSWRFYSRGLALEAAHQLALEPDLLKALRRNEFRLLYQPRIDLRTGRLRGAEALLRWQHPERGLLSPAEFIPVAEKTGFIVPLGYWVVHQACLDLNWLETRGLKLPSMGINLSFRQFQDEMLVSTISRLLVHHDVRPPRLEIELTETAMMLNEAHVARCLEALSALGVGLSLDDFGTGFSSFTHLQKLPISTLKIDRSFVQGVPRNIEDAEIVRAIISLAHNLRKDVIAEGGETSEQVAFLRAQGCDQLQGYFFSPPLAAGQLVDFDRRHVQCLSDIRSCLR